MDGGSIGPKQVSEGAPPPFRERTRSQEIPIVRLPGDPPREKGTAAPLDREQLLRTRIKDLALHIAGTKVELLVEELYKDLAAAGVAFRPPCYLSDEWGCPDGKPIIGVPFYLADEKLVAMEGEVSEVREEEKESLQYLRHESGHAFCYAYELYNDREFLALFGPFTRPYVDDYRVMPFSRSFVRHLPGWYAQKHPDDDFAETFAVFVTPGSNWRQTYATWPALKKLEFVEAKVREFGQTAPKVINWAPELPDEPVELMEETVGELFERGGPPADVGQELGVHFDPDLRHIFADEGPVSAADVLEAARRQIIPAVAYWTGLAQPVVKAVLLHLIARCRELKLAVRAGGEAEGVAKASVLVTTLAMNRVYSGKFGEL